MDFASPTFLLKVAFIGSLLAELSHLSSDDPFLNNAGDSPYIFILNREARYQTAF